MFLAYFIVISSLWNTVFSSYPSMTCYSDSSYINALTVDINNVQSAYFVNGIESSVHGEAAGALDDRTWQWRYCRQSSTPFTSVSSLSRTTGNDAISSDCGSVNTHAALIGAQAFYNDNTEDREWIFQCGTLDTSKYLLTDCYSTGYLNNYNEAITNWYCSDDGVIRKVCSIHDNVDDDRRWDFVCCRMSNVEFATPQPSAQPTKIPSSQPTMPPTPQPTMPPTSQPTKGPISHPTLAPTGGPTEIVSSNPSQTPTETSVEEDHVMIGTTVTPKNTDDSPVVVQTENGLSFEVVTIVIGCPVFLILLFCACWLYWYYRRMINVADVDDLEKQNEAVNVEGWLVAPHSEVVEAHINVIVSPPIEAIEIEARAVGEESITQSETAEGSLRIEHPAARNIMVDTCVACGVEIEGKK